MIDKADPELAAFALIIEASIGDFVAELRAIDLVDLIGFIRFESYPTLEDLVNSSTELFFWPEMMMFSWAAGVDVRWDALPVVTLGLEFRHPIVTAFFNLTLRDKGQSVEVLGITFDRPRATPREDLARALAEAQLPRSGLMPPVPLLGAAAARTARKGLPWS